MFPLSGHTVDEWQDPNIREVPFRGYRLIYKVFDDGILILTLSHAARLLPPEPPHG
jgi:hypothetical protein